MKAVIADPSDFRFAQIGTLAERTRRALKPGILALAGGCGIATVLQLSKGQPGAVAFALISLGACLALVIWRQKGAGLPLLPMLVIQHLIVYGLPLIVSPEDAAHFSADELTRAGIELLVFFLALACSWRMGMGAFSFAPPVSYALSEMTKGGTKRLNTIGFALIVLAFAYQILERTGLLDELLAVLPNGSFSLIWALVSAAGTCGFFIVSLLLGGGELPVLKRLLFWFFLAANCYIACSSFLLSSAVIMVAAVLIGLFWSTGRVPWAYIIVIGAVFSFLNIGKVVMRERYWGTAGADNIPEFTLQEMPDKYNEWFQASYDSITGDLPKPARLTLIEEQTPESQTLLQRINNLQNLLFVIVAMDMQHMPPLYGATYAIVPKLLIPKILWPEKPGTHEGQIMLNVHFGRQDIESTTTTYVAWGLLPEAYGNFGPIMGALVLGGFLGFLFAWIEKFTAQKLLISMEGFVSFTVFLAMTNSFELVASVLVTSIEQSILPIMAATLPFVHQTVVRPPEREPT